MLESPLDANLAALGARNADVAEQIRRATGRGDLVFETADDGAATALLAGRPLASRRQPRREAARLADTVDLVEHAVVVVHGFGVGHHVAALARRMQRTGVLIVFEPDVALLRSVLERIDHSPWLAECLLVLVTDAGDRAAVARKLDGAESILAQGVDFVVHPPSRARLAGAGERFSALFAEYATAAKTTLMTTLVRAADTVGNMLGNIDHYAGGAGITDLAGAAAGRLGIVVSAGPSLRRNVHLLRDDVVRRRCVVIAVQTVLKPLLEQGVRPDFVTALDYHEISRRFYEGLDAEDVHGVTLVAEPKAHPVIIDSFPGAVRCCASPFLDKLLGDARRPMGDLPAGATVAHLAFYLARHLGCDPVAMIGQDLGFPDGLYYAPGTAIHDVWAPELNPFNTIAMMEWQRIMRHRAHLSRRTDVEGKSIYTDAQMLTYLQQFERDFSAARRAGATIIDATEGGVRKQHTIVMALAEVLRRHAGQDVAPLPDAPASLDAARLTRAEARLAEVRRQVGALRGIARRTGPLLARMLEEQHDERRLARHFDRLEGYRAEVEERMEALDLLTFINQMGTFKRLRADRRIHMLRGRDAAAHQRAQLERDRENVTWLADAADAFVEQLDGALALLRGRPRRPVGGGTGPEGDPPAPARRRAGARVLALVPIDPQRGALGHARALDEPWGERTVLQATLERLGRTEGLDGIVLLAPADFTPAIDPARIAAPVEVERCADGPWGPHRAAVASARAWADTCWRGAVAGLTVYDELLCPGAMHGALARREAAAGLLVGADWPLLDVGAETGCGAIIARFRDRPETHRLVFSQAPPGLGACLVRTDLLAALGGGDRLSTIGALLAYQPHLPQGDAIACDMNVQIDHRARSGLVRAAADGPRQMRRLRRAALDRAAEATAVDVVDALRRAERPEEGPRHVVLELTADRAARGRFAQLIGAPTERRSMSAADARAIVSRLSDLDDVVLTLGGAGDPLRHESFEDLVAFARRLGVRVHVRTELRPDDPGAIDGLLAAEPDIVSVDLNADTAATYRAMMGRDDFDAVRANIQLLVDGRAAPTGAPGPGALAAPWVVVRLLRCRETYEDLEGFFDRWQRALGTAVLDAPPPGAGDDLAPALTPPNVVAHDARRRLTILADGRAPIDPDDLGPRGGAVSVVAARWLDAWRAVLERRLETRAREATIA